MSRIAIVILIHHRHKPIDLILQTGFKIRHTMGVIPVFLLFTIVKSTVKSFGTLTGNFICSRVCSYGALCHAFRYMDCAS
jgi:hypothetical protein